MATCSVDSVSKSMLFPELGDFLALARAIGAGPVRDLGLLESAVQRPQLTLYGVELYPELAQKCAALLESLVKNHPLVDGNKRLGWAGVVVYLHINNIAFDVPDDEAFTFVVGVASGEFEFDAMVAWFEKRLPA